MPWLTPSGASAVACAPSPDTATQWRWSAAKPSSIPDCALAVQCAWPSARRARYEWRRRAHSRSAAAEWDRGGGRTSERRSGAKRQRAPARLPRPPGRPMGRLLSQGFDPPVGPLHTSAERRAERFVELRGGGIMRVAGKEVAGAEAPATSVNFRAGAEAGAECLGSPGTSLPCLHHFPFGPDSLQQLWVVDDPEAGICHDLRCDNGGLKTILELTASTISRE